MKAIKQIIYDFRKQPVISLVTVIGTAIAVFLIMIIVMIQQIDIASFAPESHRDRMLYGKFIHIVSDDGEHQMSCNIPYKLSVELYDSLPGTETTSFVSDETTTVDIGIKGVTSFIASKKGVDTEFWKVFDFTFINGRPFNMDEYNSSMKVAVITEDIARKLFETTDCIGRQFEIKRIPYHVAGVIENVSSLAKSTYSQIYIPLTTNGDTEYSFKEFSGNIDALILAKSTDNFPEIKKEVKRRLNIFESRLKNNNQKIKYHGQPYNHEEYICLAGSNNDPNTTYPRNRRLIIYALLLVIPAINLSSMTHSRLRRRTSEIGVCRAFGCTRGRIMKDIIMENFIVTLIGGIIGLVLSMAFIYFYSNIIFSSMFDSPDSATMYLTPAMLLNVSTILWTLFFCLLLNIISCAFPAWRASRVNPVEAINRINK